MQFKNHKVKKRSLQKPSKDKLKTGVDQEIKTLSIKNDLISPENLQNKINKNPKLKTSKIIKNCKKNQANLKRNLPFHNLLEECHQGINKTLLTIKILLILQEVLSILENIREKTHSVKEVSYLKVLLLMKTLMNSISRRKKVLHLEYQDRTVTWVFSTWSNKFHWSITRVEIKTCVIFCNKKMSSIHFTWICLKRSHLKEISHFWEMNLTFGIFMVLTKVSDLSLK